MYSLFNKMKDLNLNVETQVALFNTYVSRALCYAAKISEYHKGPDVEIIHTMYSKIILSVRQSTFNDMIYCEFGRFLFVMYRKWKLLVEIPKK